MFETPIEIKMLLSATFVVMNMQDRALNCILIDYTLELSAINALNAGMRPTQSSI